MKGLFNLAKKLSAGRPKVGITPSDVVHRENKWKLLRYRASGPRRYETPILMVPSLINRHYVLDLAPGRSVVADLLERGHDVFIIDWGTPGPEDRYLEFDTIAGDYIRRALHRTTKSAGTEKAHLLGYCLGGTLTTIHNAVYPERIASHVALAAPIRFHDHGRLSKWTRTSTFDIGAVVDAFGNVPWPLMQASFHLLKPTLNLQKIMAVLERGDDDEFLDGFFAMETWGADNVSFPGVAYKRYIEELYRKDALLAGTFTLHGRPVRLESIETPTLCVTFEHDHIVPKDSAAILLDRISSKDKRELHLRGGHVGAVVTPKAKDRLWRPLSQWFSARDATSSDAPHEAPYPRSARSTG